MADCPKCIDSGRGRNVYPALAVAAIAGLAITYFVVKKTKAGGDQMPVDKVVNLCQSAARKLDAFVSDALAS